MFIKKNQINSSLTNQDLTLLVTLKDRFEFTKRMCHYFSEIQYPFHIIFADGSLDNDTEQFFRDLESPRFSYEYIRYPKDETLTHFYTKHAESIKRVETPYVMLADNDDFPIPEGQLKAIEFLKKNPEYVGCNGRVAGIVLDRPEKAYGKSSFFIPYYCKTMCFQIDLDQENDSERIKKYFKDFYSIYYSIFKTDSLSVTLKAIQQMNFETLHVHEIFFSCMQLSQGKLKSLNELTYVRQKGSSQAAASCKGIFYDIFYDDMISDLKKAIQFVSEFIDKQKQEIIFSDIYNAYYRKIESDYVRIGFYLLRRIFCRLTKRDVCQLFLYKLSKMSFFLAGHISIRMIGNLTKNENLMLIKNLVGKKHDF